MIRDAIRQSLLFVSLTVIGTQVLAQSSAPGSASARTTIDLHQLAKGLPAGTKPYAEHGEVLQLKLPDRDRQAVRLFTTLDPYALVMLPTGELKPIRRADAKPTTSPFVPATPEEIVASLKGTEFAKYKVEKTKFYLYFYDCSEGFFMHTRSILDSMLNGVIEDLRALGLNVKKPEFPLVVIIMPNRKAYDKFREMPKEMVAYYDMMSNRIVMYEDEELWEAAPEFAAKQAAYTIAHENTHQLLGNVGIQNRLSNWPQWIQEGIAEYYCPLKVTSSLVRKDKSELPTRTMKWSKAGMVNDLRMYDLLKMQSMSGGLVKGLVSSEKIDAHGYALAWGLVHLLVNKKPDAFRRIWRI